MKKVLLAIFLMISAISCTNYEEKAATFIKDNKISNKIILKKTDSSPRYIIYTKSDRVFSYNLENDNVDELFKQDWISSWKVVNLSAEVKLLIVFSDDYASAWRMEYTPKNLEKIIAGNYYEDDLDTNILYFTNNRKERFKFDLKNGKTAKILSIGEYLTKEKIKEAVIKKMYDDENRSMVFYKPSDLFKSDLICYNAFDGRTYTYKDCYSILKETEYYLFISTKKDGDYSLVRIDTYTGRSETVAKGSDIRLYKQGFIVKKYDLTEEYYDEEGVLAEKPETKGIISSLFDYLTK